MYFGEDSKPIVPPNQTAVTPEVAKATTGALGFGNVGKFLVAFGIGIAAWLIFRTKDEQ